MSEGKMAGIDDLTPSTAGSGKRPHDDEDTLEGEAASFKRTKIATDVSPEQTHCNRTRSSEFYYADGNIIVIVEDVEFCLHLSRLLKHCTLFSCLWELADGEEDQTLVDCMPDTGVRDRRCTALPRKVYDPGASIAYDLGPRVKEDHLETATFTGEARHTLEGISAADFTEFLRAFENPLMYTVELPNEKICVSLVRVAHKLGCKTVSDVAKCGLRKLWPLTVPQQTSFGRRLLSRSTTIIQLARQFNIPEVLKRAYYEILRSPTFWENIATNRDSVNLVDVDLLTLFHARHILQREWRVLLFTPPVPKTLCIDSKGSRKGCTHTESTIRSEKWRSHFIDYLETTSADPLFYVGSLLERTPFTNPNGAWCTPCLEERRSAWVAAKVRWWGMLDELFKIPAAVGNAN